MKSSSKLRTSVPRITVDVVRYASEHPSQGHPYYIRESGRDAIRGCMLRVQRRKTELGIRYDNGTRWKPILVVDAMTSIEELEAARLDARRFIRSLEDEEEEPSLREGRLKFVRAMWEEYRADYVRKKSSRRSPRTLEFYDYLWEMYLLPAFGDLRLREVTVSRVEDLLKSVTEQVRVSRPWAQGCHTANHVLNQGRMVFEAARRKGLLLRNPFTEVDPYELGAAEAFLRDTDLAAVGQSLRELEAQADRSSTRSRRGPGLGALLALRITLYTACRHREELLYGRTSWLCQISEYLGSKYREPRATGVIATAVSFISGLMP